MVEAGPNFIKMKHPDYTNGNECDFVFYTNFTYDLVLDTGDVHHRAFLWKLSHETHQLLYKFDLTEGWKPFWDHNDAGVAAFYHILTEWMEVDNILLGPESDTKGM